MSKYSNNMPPSLKGAVEWLYDDISPGSTLLDVGCSTGYFGAFLKESKKCKVYGIEISDDRKEAQKVLDGVYSFDLDLEWPKDIFERKYDYVFLGDVIEHLKDPKRVLVLLKKLIKPDGLIFISTPNIAHISIRLELLGGNFEYESMGILDETHLKYFTIKSLEELASGAGYKIIRVDSSTNDFPKEVTANILSGYGLVPNDTFWNIANSPESRTYQYKLVLKPSKSKTSKPKPLEVQKKPLQYRDDLLQDLESQITALKAHADEQAKIIEHYKGLSEMYQARPRSIREIKNSLVHGIRRKSKN